MNEISTFCFIIGDFALFGCIAFLLRKKIKWDIERVIVAWLMWTIIGHFVTFIAFFICVMITGYP